MDTGYLPLLERVAHHTGVQQECIVTASGTSMANHLAMAALLDPGDEVLIEQPTYGLLLDVAHYLRARVRRLQRRFENGFAVDLNELEKSVSAKTRLIVLTNLHNPTGVLIPAETVRGSERSRAVTARTYSWMKFIWRCFSMRALRALFQSVKISRRIRSLSPAA